MALFGGGRVPVALAAARLAALQATAITQTTQALKTRDARTQTTQEAAAAHLFLRGARTARFPGTSADSGRGLSLIEESGVDDFSLHIEKCNLGVTPPCSLIGELVTQIERARAALAATAFRFRFRLRLIMLLIDGHCVLNVIHIRDDAVLAVAELGQHDPTLLSSQLAAAA